MSTVSRRNALALTGAGLSAVLANVAASAAMVTPAVALSRAVLDAARAFVAALDHVAELDDQLDASGVTSWEPWRATRGSPADRWFINGEGLRSSIQARAFFTGRRTKIANHFNPSQDPAWGD